MPARHVIIFSARFAPLVQSGAKLCTIRPPRKRPIHKGDLLDLRAWTGKPYRSKQRKLRMAVCLKVSSIEMDSIGGLVHLLRQSGNYCEKAEAFARREGFQDRREMIAWFKSTHGFPFTGQLIEWSA